MGSRIDKLERALKYLENNNKGSSSQAKELRRLIAHLLINRGK